jgi:hypothetical protein
LQIQKQETFKSAWEVLFSKANWDPSNTEIDASPFYVTLMKNIEHFLIYINVVFNVNEG